MARLIVALDPATEDRLLADVVEHGHDLVARAADWREVVTALDGAAIDVVLVGAAAETLSAELLAACDERAVRLVAVARDDRERAMAAQLGLHEVVDASAPWAEIERLVSGGVRVASRVAGPLPPAPGGSRVVAVWGPAGAPGRTTIAVNLAAELAATGLRVAIVDADPYGGAIAPLLGLLDEAPGFASACRLTASGSLDRAELVRIAQRSNASRAAFDVFTGLVGPNRWPELAEDRVTAALEAIRTIADVVVVDTGFSLEADESVTGDPFAPRRNGATFAALAAADRVLAVGLADPIGLSRLLRGHAELLEHVEAERIDVVVNRVRASVLGVDASVQVRQTLRRFGAIDRPVLLPNDARACDAAVLAGAPLSVAAPRSPLRFALRGYADAVFASSAVRTGRRRRALPGLGRPAPVGRSA
ncbi:P-loop NTPase [Agromyces intestinalis]|uniref:P-loop NTPase n=1 Tax=Agromyces intestinalis TaxID=2592652 RepID=A0A5C1YBV2_9MICO|nr:P-loop NTPase [Agromyces intestinalis]QEO13491.1 P-loop NTPase [Agromyces intestinalis]